MKRELRRLIEQIRRGEPGALDEFARAYGNPIRTLARHCIVRLRIERETEPDEILDATILELCRRFKRISTIHPEDFLLYVERIVRSEVLDIWRRSSTRKRGRGWKTLPTCSELLTRRTDYSSTDGIELEDAIRHAYDGLDGSERLISMLRRSGWTWRDIASRLKTHPDTLRKRWERAMARVQRSWE